ncbi:MAG: carbon-nitrogen hydrolase family protein [Gammaproteobacteria bacterium]|nr:carbon-nitrogen hydrolase family protein [Gammaproteobacteria bacterium]
MEKIAAIQMASGPNLSANLIEAERLVSMAAKAGAKLVVLPENFFMMGMKEEDKLKHLEPEGASGPLQLFLSQLAVKQKIWLVGGTVPLQSPQAGKCYASSLLFDDHGDLVARYDKIHLFDVHIKESGEEYQESKTIAPGERCVVVDTPFGRLGLAVCYDLRFPSLFQVMAAEGVEIITLPSAFTAITGKAHWDILVRARAIETFSYVVASAQGGYHRNGRETYGHSMVVDPWGSVSDLLPSGSGFVIADLDRKCQAEIRSQFPALHHRRFDCHLRP